MRAAICLAVAVITVVSPSAAPSEQPRAVKALVGGTLVDGYAGPPIRNSVILIDGDKISAVGQVGTLAVPQGADVISTEGMTVLPGLWDMHVHSVSNVALDRANAAVAAQDWHFPLFLAHGVTGVRYGIDGPATIPMSPSQTTPNRWEAQVNTTTLADGPHQITVVATDQVPLQSSASVTITVLNGASQLLHVERIDTVLLKKGNARAQGRRYGCGGH